MILKEQIQRIAFVREYIIKYTPYPSGQPPRWYQTKKYAERGKRTHSK